MEPKYEELRLLSQSEKSMVHLLREKGGEQLFVRKKLTGRHPVYSSLQEYPHPFLPKLYDVSLTDDSTTVIEEYIEGQTPDSADLSRKQFLDIVRDLCSVLEFLHAKGIIHRDIKPSNILLAQDGHIRLIDFDAARLPKKGLAQDTKPLGTRGYAPPEQYGFAQTDARTDIYALGVTLKQLSNEKIRNPRYERIIRKCTDLNPDRRYQSVRQVRQAFLGMGSLGIPQETVLFGSAAVVLLFAAILLWNIVKSETLSLSPRQDSGSSAEDLTVLPAPENPHWMDDTGIGAWGLVPNCGANGIPHYYWRLYRTDSDTPPSLDDDTWVFESSMMGRNSLQDEEYTVSMSDTLTENGFYFFAVSAMGDGVQYADSPLAMSDAFEYTGESAPPLPSPEGLFWNILTSDSNYYYAFWNNLEDYEEQDNFDIRVYDVSGQCIMRNIWTKKMILETGLRGFQIPVQYLPEDKGPYRFAIQVYSSRPNEYGSSLMPDPIPEEYYSPWYPADP